MRKKGGVIYSAVGVHKNKDLVSALYRPEDGQTRALKAETYKLSYHWVE